MLQEAAPHQQVLRKFYLYETRTRYYLVGRTKDRRQWRVLKLNRSEAWKLDVVEDPIIYTEQECRRLLTELNDGNAKHGGATLLLQADAVLGCFKFLEGHYLLFAVKKRLHGNICGQKVYGVANIGLISLVEPSVADTNFTNSSDTGERKYRKLLSGVELTKNFFFSYTYPLWLTLQAAMTQPITSANGAEQPKEASAGSSGSFRDTGQEAAVPVGGSPFDSMFVWNDFLTKPLRAAVGNDRWTTPLVHGFWQQRTLEMLGLPVRVTLIARRSRHFAGTRYRRRGVNDAGHVANDVETEQIVSAGRDWRSGLPVVSSSVQVRGSIPLYWNQDSAARVIKPEIQLQSFDPLFAATRLHFEDLALRYGRPTVVLNLVKSVEKRPRESLLCREFSRAIGYVNKQVPHAEDTVRHIAWDFHAHARQRGAHILAQMAPIIVRCLSALDVFCLPPAAAASTALKDPSTRPDWVCVSQLGGL
ncbi:hypothetical protein WJX73_002623 [Symbiochloris irregularis]|uniref:SAC domain-containing protein n=1 Tax=Symbiochloris irregularis TaxID=706552 RepID=A0AAW1NIF4_9CHLO